MKLTIAIQKSGRLKEDSLRLLRDSGISIENGIDSLKTTSDNFPLEVLYLRSSDIPQYIRDSIVDIGIVGQNVLIEQNCDALEDIPLGFGKCRLAFAIPKDAEYPGIEYFNSKKIATSYPVTTNKYLSEFNINSEIHTISGSVEIAPNIGLSDAICDLVSTGNTLFKNGLKEVEAVLKSEACLAKQSELSEDKKIIYENLKFRMKSVLEARNNKYVLLNAPNDCISKITDILPGIKSPTIIPLALEGWSSMHSVINENKFWNVIGQLRSAGAEGILVCPIEKIIR